MDRRRRLAAVDAAVRQADPIGLLDSGAPYDEYDPEVADIERRLRPDMTPDQAGQVVDEVMRKWFSAEVWDQHRGRSIESLSSRLSEITSADMS